MSARLRGTRARLGLAWQRTSTTLTIMTRVVAVLLVAAMAVVLTRAVERYLRTADVFAIKNVDVRGNERLRLDEIRAMAGLTIGKNVFDTSPREVEQRLRANPAIAEAHAERRLPGTYDITLREHHAVALLALTDLYFVSEDGTVFKRLEAGDSGDRTDLPVITGVDEAAFRDDRPYRTAVLLAAVALLADCREAGLERVGKVSEIRVEADRSMSLYVGEGTTQGAPPVLVQLGVGPFQSKLRRLKRVFDDRRLGGDALAYVLLDNARYPERVTVRRR